MGSVEGSRRESRLQEHASGGLRPPQTRAATLLRDARHDGPSGRPDDGAQDARRLARADAQAEVDHRGAAALEPDGAFELPAFRGFLETGPRAVRLRAGGRAPRDGRDGLLRRRGGPRGWGLARHGCAGHAEELAAAGHTRPRRSRGQHAWHHPVQRGCLQGRVRDLRLWPARAAERNPEILETASRDR
jgi:hypothetical protein